MCEFVDDSLSAFKFNDLIACGCGSLVEWTDFNPEVARPRCARVPPSLHPRTRHRLGLVSIKKTLTTSGRNVTCKAGRGGKDVPGSPGQPCPSRCPLDGGKAQGTMEIIE
jgi:hypothetical protein